MIVAPMAVFRVDASVAVGGGHARRCLVLAKALLDGGWSVRFASAPETVDTVPALRGSGVDMMTLGATAEPAATMRATAPDGCDLLVVDHYGLDRAFESPLRPWARRIAVIDDLADRPHDCDILVDQTPGRAAADYRGLVPSDCAVLVGPDYALLDARFAAARAMARRRDGTVRRVLVNHGATDPTGATLAVLQALRAADLGVPVDIVAGAANPHRAAIQAAAAQLAPAGTVHVDVDDMAALIGVADFAIGAGGVSALERCCLGVPSVIVILADNQRGNAEELARAGAAVCVEEAALHRIEGLAALIGALGRDPARLERMSAAATRIVDGAGAVRVREACARLVEPALRH